MAFGPGEWVEFVRTVPGASKGQRGKVTSTGFLGGLDVRLENGATITGVDASAVVASGPSTMPFTPGDWVELVRNVPGGTRGQRGKVTGTGFTGGLDLELENGERVRGVDRSAVVASGPSTVSATSSSGGGSRLLGTVLAVLAVLLIVAVVVWLRWGT